MSDLSRENCEECNGTGEVLGDAAGACLCPVCKGIRRASLAPSSTTAAKLEAPHPEFIEHITHDERVVAVIDPEDYRQLYEAAHRIAVSATAAALPAGWQVWRTAHTVETLGVKSPEGHVAFVSAADRNPALVLFMLAKALSPNDIGGSHG